nr:MAG TPA: hypothetical protein [Caudoviricetes sp.]
MIFDLVSSVLQSFFSATPIECFKALIMACLLYFMF